MLRRLWIPCVAALALYGFISVLAQSPTQSQGQQPALPSYQSSAPSVDTQGVRGYKLGPGDVLDVRVWGQPDLASQPEIDEDGNLSSLPFIEEPIPAKCRTETEIQKSITEAYSKYLVKPRVSVKVFERKSSAPVTVYGAVLRSNQIPTIRRLQLHEVIANAGGFTATSGGTIQIIHTQPEMCPEPNQIEKTSDVGEIAEFKIRDLRAGGAGDPFIRPGDIVYVAEGEQIFVTGLVYNPQVLILRDPISLTEALGKSGGLQRLANPKEVHIWRQKDGKMGGEDLKVNFDAIRKGEQKDIALQGNDVIDVRELGPLSGKKLFDLLSGLPTVALTKVPVR